MMKFIKIKIFLNIFKKIKYILKKLFEQILFLILIIFIFNI